MSNNMTALVLAASRKGPQDSVAQLQDTSHKCLVHLDGMPMLERTVRALQQAKRIGRIVICIEDAAVAREIPYIAAQLDAGHLEVVRSKGNLFQSVVAAAEVLGTGAFPLAITTADNVLHTPEFNDYFVTAFLEWDMDVAIAMTPAEVLLAAYPEGQRAFHRLKDGAYSSCNLYGLRTPAAVSSAKAFAGGGQFGKKPLRIIAAFGYLNFICYRYKLDTLDGMMRRLTKRFKMKVQVIRMPFADGPIDVDNPKDFALVEKILKTRRGGA